MSETLRVTLDGSRLAASQEEDLCRLVRAAARTVIPAPTIPSIRLVIREEPSGTTLEPFVASAAIEALLRLPRKRDEARNLLSLIVGCAFWFSDEVGVLLAPEGAASHAGRTDLPFASLASSGRLGAGWHRIVASLSWLHFPQVEAKLLQPLKLATGAPATHYFREFWARPITSQVAHGAVACTVEKDGARVVAFGEVTPSVPSRVAEQGNLVTSGRVYFSDRGR